MNTTLTTIDDWELRIRPYKNPRTGITSDTEVTITAIHREHGWVLMLERSTPERVASFNPSAIWANGATR